MIGHDLKSAKHRNYISEAALNIILSVLATIFRNSGGVPCQNNLPFHNFYLRTNHNFTKLLLLQDIKLKKL